jgi:hypothetical protein
MERTLSMTQAHIAQYEFSIPIEASTSQVWRALADQIDSWWLSNFRMLGEASRVDLEPRAGGRLFEYSHGAELLWYTVIAIDFGKSIDFAGYCTAKYGGPVTTMLSLEVASISERIACLNVSDSLFGHVTDESVRCVQEGWKNLFTHGLKKFVEEECSNTAIDLPQE